MDLQFGVLIIVMKKKTQCRKPFWDLSRIIWMIVYVKWD